MIQMMIGGRTFQVEPLTLGADDRWRRQYAEVLEPLTEMAQMAMAADGSERLPLLAVRSPAVRRPMLMLDALIGYAPALEAERAWLEENAVAMELVMALSEIFFMGAMSTSPQSGDRPAVRRTTSPS